MIEFNLLAMKADTDELHTIFLLKKNVQQDIIKMILDYPPIATLETLKEWKVAIMSVGQEYEFMEWWQDYKTSTGITYGEQGQPMDIRKSNNNFKDRKPKCFNCNKYEHMVKKCRSKKKEWETQTYFKCDKEGHIAKDCKEAQSIKKWKIQEELDDKDNNKKKEEGFDNNFK